MWLTLISGLVKAWNGFVKFAGWIRELMIYNAGKAAQEKAQQDAARDEAEEMRRLREDAEDMSDEELDSVLRGDDDSDRV